MSEQSEVMFVAMAFQTAWDDGDPERIKYWLKLLGDKQLRRLIHVCKKLTVLAENELHVERPMQGTSVLLGQEQGTNSWTVGNEKPS